MKFLYTISYKQKIIYVGTSVNPFKRRFQHYEACFNKKHKAYHHRIYKVIRKLGINLFTFEHKLTFTTVGQFENFLEKEDELIRLYNPIGNNYNAVLNESKQKAYNDKYFKSEKWKQKRDEYYQKNKDRLLAMRKAKKQKIMATCDI